MARQAIADPRRPSQRPRVEQSGKPETARNAVRRSDAGCASGSFFGGNGKGICRARCRVSGPGRRESVSFAGRSAVPRRGRYGLALLRKSPKMQLPCRRLRRPRRVVSDMGRRPLVRRRWHRRSPFPVRQGMPPPAPRPPRSPRQVRLRSRTSLVPSCPASRQKVSRSCRAAVLLDSPPSLPTERVANPCPMPVHPPGDSRMR